ncbi:peptidase S8 [Hymenobacter sp. DG25B]|uniref:S8 family serine peptidase n=1 Tax=Hymenobacter sp. DG25B TaxID=1385664 RepID=UPI000540B93A|nr:S8 family serine peptidase [Hymenobacter sp. DG25B]AIZ63650.1 peptidase S8 [Hymenobacter sp. DG25B]
MSKSLLNFRVGTVVSAATLSIAMLAGCAKDTIAPAEPGISGAVSAAADAKAVGQVIPGRYIVVLKEGSVTLGSEAYEEKIKKVKGVAQGLLKQRGLRPEKVERAYGHALKGFSAELTADEAAQLAQDASVAYVEADQVITIEQTTGTTTTTSTQTVPYGIKRVGYGSGVGKVAWIIDTGIDLTHPDLTVDKTRSRTFITSGTDATTANDGNGHGTHVAGTIAAKNNLVGVVGVAAGATLVAVKVLAADGSGTSSGVIAGIDYVAANAKAGNVANMSLGGGTSQALDDAVTRAANKGILFAVAAGNDAKSATLHSPARVNNANVFTISAMNNLDTWASFSCFGNPPVDYCMPGVSITSTYKGGQYATMSGTSMATPHMAGVLLMRGKSFTRSGYVKSDPDGKPDPIAHL